MTADKISLKKRKVSKKTKRSWRKHVDITDVDKFLENSRFEERLGPPISEVPDAKLFTIYTSTNPVDAPILSKRERRLALLTAEPRCFASLKPHTEVPDPITKRNRVRTAEERKHPIKRKIDAERKRNGILKLKERIALKNRALADEKRMQKPKRGEFEIDVWDGNFNKVTGINTEWMTSDAKRHTLELLGIKKKKFPASLHKKTSVLPAVEPPHPGTSYNPSYDDHQNLLQEVAEKEMKLMKEEEHLERVTTKMFTRLSAKQKQKNMLDEMSQGLPIDSQKSISNVKTENEENTEDNGESYLSGPAQRAKKTLKQKRKQREQKELARSLEARKIDKKKVADVYKLQHLKKQLAKKEEKEKMLREKRLKVKALKAKEAKTLSRVKFEPAEQVFTMPSDLSGNLRNAPALGSLLKDRFKSLQQRNIIAPSTLILKQTKGKVKKFIKEDHKIPEIHGRK